jgi:hypothetical protein
MSLMLRWRSAYSASVRSFFSSPSIISGIFRGSTQNMNRAFSGFGFDGSVVPPTKLQAIMSSVPLVGRSSGGRSAMRVRSRSSYPGGIMLGIEYFSVMMILKFASFSAVAFPMNVMMV